MPSLASNRFVRLLLAVVILVLFALAVAALVFELIEDADATGPVTTTSAPALAASPSAR